MPDLKFQDPPQFTPRDLQNAADFVRKLEALREQVQKVIGTRGVGRGNPAWVIDGIGRGLLNDDGTPAPTPSPPPGPPDTTPPPTPSGLTTTAGINNVFIEWTAPTYTQGGGNAYTTIYGATYSGTGPLPTFGTAVKLASVPFSTEVYALPSAPGVEWHIWITFTTYADIEGNPAGGTNGSTCTTAKIGNVNLADLIVSAEKLAAGTYAGLNLVPNPGAEDGAVAWATGQVAGGGGAFSVDTAQKTSGAQSFKITKSTDGDGLAVSCLAFPVIPGETYSVKVKVRSNAASANGLYVRMEEKATKPSTNYVTTSNRDSFTSLVNNGARTASWVEKEFQYTVPAGIYWVSLALYDWTNTSGATILWWDDCAVGRQITASFLAAGCIAVGTAAIENAAIVNAMIANLAVDNAKIANCSVSKLVAGSLSVGEYIQSSGFVSGSAGFRISGNGNAEFNNAIFRGLIDADSGNIGGAVINSTGIQSSNYIANTQGWRLDNASGTAFLMDVQLPVGIVTASSKDYSSYGTVSWPSSTSVWDPYPTSGAGMAGVLHTRYTGTLVIRADAMVNVQFSVAHAITSVLATVTLARKPSAGSGTVVPLRSWDFVTAAVPRDTGKVTASITVSINYQFAPGELTVGTDYYFALYLENVEGLDASGNSVTAGSSASDLIEKDAFVGTIENKV